MQVATRKREATGRERLFFEGVEAPVVTRVRRRDAGGLTVDQPLPFLSLDAQVRDAAGRSAHIRSVGVSVEGGTPHLVLELAYDERRDSTVRAYSPRRPRRARRDETVSYTRLAVTDTREGMLDAEPASPREGDAPIVFRLELDAAQPATQPEPMPSSPPWWHVRWLRDLLR